MAQRLAAYIYFNGSRFDVTFVRANVSWFMQVDISTMLEEAVQYVKFLQLQIKVITKEREKNVRHSTLDEV